MTGEEAWILPTVGRMEDAEFQDEDCVGREG